MASAVNQLFTDNRWTSPTHSDAGNVTVQYPTGPGLTYDAEARIIGATEPNMAAISYQYDADGGGRRRRWERSRPDQR